jgi:hypothetical protein
MSMLLRGANEAEFELALIEDRFPELQDAADDSAYLTLSIRVGAPEETWEETAPCVNIYELQTLVEWLEAVAMQLPEVGEVDLLEPELNFSLARENAGDVILRVRFHLEGQPDELALGAPANRDYIDLRIKRSQVRCAAAELRNDLETVVSHTRRGPAAREEESGMLGGPEEDLGIAPPEVAGDLDESDDERMF